MCTFSDPFFPVYEQNSMKWVVIFPKIWCCSPPTMLGDVSHKRSVGQIPRGPQDMYNVRPSVPSEKVGSTKNSVVKLEPFGCYLLFCINHSEFYVLSDDPTLNVPKDMILLTVTVHKNLKLLKKRKLENPQYLLDPCYCIKIVIMTVEGGGVITN